MRREPGRLYVYLSYGVHFCLNIVAHEPGEAGAVLIRALQPPSDGDMRIASGPGRVSRTLGIDLSFDDLYIDASDEIQLIQGAQGRLIETSGRVGITRDVDRPWRFFDPCSPSVSGSRRVRT
jgi:DNA-3-methyladenine glycosylase